MKKVVIIPNYKKDEKFIVSSNVAVKLCELGFEVLVDERFISYFKQKTAKPYVEFPEDADLIAVVGGDGSVIDASKYAINYDIPIIGVNLGKVGYLSEIEPDNLSVLDGLINGDYQIEEKMLLASYTESNGVVSEQLNPALNDIVISHEGYLGIALGGLQHGSDLLAALHVACIIDKATHRIFFQGRTGSLPRCQHIRFPGGVARIVCARCADRDPGDPRDRQRIRRIGGIIAANRQRDLNRTGSRAVVGVNDVCVDRVDL